MRITIRNKSTGEQLVLSLDDFKRRFKTEFVCAYQRYLRHETERTAYLPDFMLNLAWNFKNYAVSEWYISRIS